MLTYTLVTFVTKKINLIHVIHERNLPVYLTMLLLQNGSFVVRSSRQAGPNKPFVMTILCRNELFHVPIRRRSDSCYAVGEDKPDELVRRPELYLSLIHI